MDGRRWNESAPHPIAPVTRRNFLYSAGAFGLLAGLDRLAPPFARPWLRAGDGTAESERRLGGTPRGEFDLTIDETRFGFGGRRATATTINGTIPGPLLRFREGEDVVIRVTNRLDEDTSIHWHGVLVPNGMDGVPDVNFPGIRPGETFTYRFPIRQYGTYWYHSHSGLQEQTGHYGPLIIDPAEPEPYTYDREYVVMLSDWTFEDPYRVLDKLKKQANYYNLHRRTVGDLFRDAKRFGWRAALRDRAMWAGMRMDPTDISDVTGATYTFLMNGRPPHQWVGLFRPSERVRLRFINAGAGTLFDVRIPGLEMQVVQVSGQDVQPVVTDEFRIAIAETYDVIVQPRDDSAYTIFAEAIDRSGYAMGTLTTRVGMNAPVPALRHPPVLTMADMGMAMDMAGIDMPGMDMPGMNMPGHQMPGMGGDTAGMKMGRDTSAMRGMPMPAPDTAARDTTTMPGHDMRNMPAPPAESARADTSGMKGMPGMPGHAMPATPLPKLSVGTVPTGETVRLPDGSLVRTTGLSAPGSLPATVDHQGDKHGSGNSAVPMQTGSRLHEPGPGLGADGWRVLLYTQLRSIKPFPEYGPPEREIELHLTGNMERFMWSINGIRFSDVKEPIRVRLGERFRLTMVNDTMMQHPMHLHGMWMHLENGTDQDIPRVHTINLKPAERVSVLVQPDEVGPWAFHCHILNHMEVGMFRVVEVVGPASAAAGQ